MIMLICSYVFYIFSVEGNVKFAVCIIYVLLVFCIWDLMLFQESQLFSLLQIKLPQGCDEKPENGSKPCCL